MYEITIADLKYCLSTLALDQVAGIPSRPRACLVAKMLEKKYGHEFHVDSDRYSAMTGGRWLELPEDVRGVVRAFDYMAPVDNPTEIAITREQVEENIPELKGSNNA